MVQCTQLLLLGCTLAKTQTHKVSAGLLSEEKERLHWGSRNPDPPPLLHLPPEPWVLLHPAPPALPPPGIRVGGQGATGAAPSLTLAAVFSLMRSRPGLREPRFIFVHYVDDKAVSFASTPKAPARGWSPALCAWSRTESRVMEMGDTDCPVLGAVVQSGTEGPAWLLQPERRQ